MLIVLFLVLHFNFWFVPCGGLSWLPVSFLLHVKYTVSYRIVFLQTNITSQIWPNRGKGELEYSQSFSKTRAEISMWMVQPHRMLSRQTLSVFTVPRTIMAVYFQERDKSINSAETLTFTIN